MIYLGSKENTDRETEKKKRERKAAQQKVCLWAKYDSAQPGFNPTGKLGQPVKNTYLRVKPPGKSGS